MLQTRKLLGIGTALVTTLFAFSGTAWANSSTMQFEAGYENASGDMSAYPQSGYEWCYRPNWDDGEASDENSSWLDVYWPGTTGNPTVDWSHQTAGGDVLAVQQILDDVYNKGLTTDGYYGSNTEAAIKWFQGYPTSVVGSLSQDGSVGPNTWYKISQFVDYSNSFISNGLVIDEYEDNGHYGNSTFYCENAQDAGQSYAAEWEIWPGWSYNSYMMDGTRYAKGFF